MAKKRIQFNRNLRTRENLTRVIGWIGRYDANQTEEIVSNLIPKITPQQVNSPGSFIEIETPYDARIRAIIFHLGYSSPDKNQSHFIGFEEIMNFIWQCLRPEDQRSECQTIYDFGLWGSLYEPIVRYFKDKQRQEPGTPTDLISYIRDRYHMIDKSTNSSASALNATGEAAAGDVAIRV